MRLFFYEDNDHRGNGNAACHHAEYEADEVVDEFSHTILSIISDSSIRGGSVTEVLSERRQAHQRRRQLARP